MSVTTKTGDKGQTSLFTGERVDKDSLRVEVYGTIDEVDAALAMARAFSEKDEVTKRIYGVQQKLGRLMADFASLGKEPLITAADVKAMEDDIAVLEDALPEQNSFIIPGDTKAGAMLDHARTVVCQDGSSRRKRPPLPQSPVGLLLSFDAVGRRCLYILG